MRTIRRSVTAFVATAALLGAGLGFARSAHAVPPEPLEPPPAPVSPTPIDLKYEALGGGWSLLGQPVAREAWTANYKGRYRNYQNGSIYWSPNTGAWEIHGLIRAKWLALGGAQSFLGFPVTDETATPKKDGAYNHFQSGSIYWSPSTGANEVHGAIRGKWASLGWEKSLLGYPVTDERITPDNDGRYSHFQYGSIYWSSESGAHEVHGAIRDKWASLGWERGYLGFPLSDETVSKTEAGTRFSVFQHGTLYWDPQKGAHLKDLPAGYVKVRIEARSFSPWDFEDWGPDEFYLVGAFTNGVERNAYATRSITTGNVTGGIYPYRPGEAVFFDAAVREGDVVRGGLVAFDEDCAGSWEQYRDKVKKFADAAAAGLSALGQPEAGAVIKVAVGVWDFGCSQDEDDRLGTLPLDIPASGDPVEDSDWNFWGSTWKGNWNYTVRYRITRLF